MITGQFVGNIYRNAKKNNGTLPTEPKAYFDKIVQLVTQSQQVERWFSSGWTLQEGVLLPETIFIDGASNALQHETFMHNGGHASVIDLTVRITRLAVEVAQPFLLFTWQMNFDKSSMLWSLLAPSRTVRLPLYILNGKQSRKFGMEQDSCWALIGARELEGVTVNYTLSMDEIKMIFLTALINKYQWSMLLLPQPLFSVNGGQLANDFKWTNIVDGLLIPVGVFVDSQIGLGSPSMLPRMSLDNATTITVQPPQTSQTFTSWKNSDIKWYLHYVQTEEGVEIRSPASNTNSTLHISDAVFLKLEDLGKNDKAPTASTGMRCVAIMGLGTPQIKESAGVFGGIVDLWFAGGSKVEVPSLKIHLSAH
ncbi:hypothetical protein BPOR_0012g00380 [Botrytis porri]|uniref:Heterokaryon incompatibility domain-containing protein n=1 Tax=Botrytis porri TaxID=87229 RepID=A0A4Z1L5H7_9HELO|nr:hypothetical protein BPOR_0012g00380 [Botrytis porri]